MRSRWFAAGAAVGSATASLVLRWASGRALAQKEAETIIAVAQSCKRRGVQGLDWDAVVRHVREEQGERLTNGAASR